MPNWLASIKSLISLKDVPDERLYSVIPPAIADADAFLMAKGLTSLYDEATIDTFPHLKYAITHYAISRLVLSLRELSSGNSMIDTTSAGVQWGDGTVRPAAVTDLLKMANTWKTQADALCLTHISSFPYVEQENPGWYDI